MAKKNIALIGYMGTGKTTIGQKLADKLDVTFVDTDALIEAQQGKHIAKIFETEGEQAFRKIEETLLEVLVEQKNILISTGGGIVLSEKNRMLLKDKTFLVTLEAKPESIYNRVKGDTNRPLLKEANPYQKILDMLEQRRPFYDIGQIIIKTDQCTLCDGVEQIISAYQKS